MKKFTVAILMQWKAQSMLIAYNVKNMQWFKQATVNFHDIVQLIMLKGFPVLYSNLKVCFFIF